MSLTTYGLSDLQAIIAAAYASQPGTVPANVGAGSQLGPSFNAAALAMLLLQNQNVYIDAIARLGTIPDPLPDGTPNPDVDSFVNPFNFFRSGPQPPLIYCQFSIKNPAGPNGVLIPVGQVVSPVGGPTFSVIPNGYNYNINANGYYISPGQTTGWALTQCSVGGVAGNVLANAINLVITGLGQPPAPYSVTNPNAAGQANGGSVPANTLGVASEVGQALKNRFALYISGGGEGTPNSILAAALAVQAGLTISYGDLVKAVKSMGVWNFTPNTPSWFTLTVAVAGSGADPSSTLLDEITAAIINTVRPAGISFAVAAPNLITVNTQGQVWVLPGFDKTATVAAVDAACQTFINNINMDPYGNQTVCAISQVYTACQAVPGVQFIDNLQLNGGTADLTAPYGSMFSAGTMNFAAH